MMDRTKKAWINALVLLVTLVINTLGAVGIINGLSQKAISDKYITLITPAPSTFSIWSVIYALLITAVIVMIIRKDDRYYQRAIDEITVLFWISSILNILWIVTFSYLLVEISVLLILGFAVTLTLICQKLLKIQEGRRWLLPLAFGLYSGWLFIATVVNVSAALVKQNWNGFGLSADTWAIIMLAIAIVLVIAVISKIRNAVLPLPIAWAYLGIYQFLASPNGFKGQYGLLQIAALTGMVILIGVAAIQLYKNKFWLLPSASIRHR